MNTLTRKFTLHHNESLVYDKGMHQQETTIGDYTVLTMYTMFSLKEN